MIFDDSDSDGVIDPLEINWNLITFEGNEIHFPNRYECASESITGTQMSADGMEALIEHCENNGIKIDTFVYNPVLPLKTDILSPDTDKDGINDSKDKTPVETKLYNYFIYYARDDFDTSHDMDEAARWMAEYAYNNEDCVFYKVTYREDFVKCWNELIPDKVQNIHIYTHGQTRSPFNKHF